MFENLACNCTWFHFPLCKITDVNQFIALYNERVTKTNDPLISLRDKLDLLVERIESYEQFFPAREHAVRAALGELRRLAQQAISETRSLQDAIAVPELPEQPFTPREGEVLSLAARGLTNKEIAYRLGISERTVQFHMKSIFNKTATNSRTEAVVMAIEKGWLKKS